VKFLVATHSYLVVVDITDDFQLKNIQLLDNDYYYGCDVLPYGKIFCCKRNEPQSKRSTTGFRIWQYQNASFGLDLSGLATRHNIIDIHQATYGHKGIYLTSTGNNEIIHVNNHFHEDFRSTFGSGNVDINHINSIDIVDDLVYVVFHNLAREPSQLWRFKYTGNDIEPEGIEQLPHYSIHNVVLDGDVYHYNASDNGAIMRGLWGDLDHYDTVEIGREWHPKGMCITDDYVISGFSEHAVDTPRRFVSESGLVFIDRESWTEAGRVILEYDQSWIGNINEIRLLP